MTVSEIKLGGYDLLGESGCEGIRYAWVYKGNKFLLESAAFCHRRKGEDEPICGYTTSVSLGCILRSLGCSCTFCKTGNTIPFIDMLSAIDIAKQNILMVLADMNCSQHSFIHNSQREFAYMGQGEPGFSYAQVRLAIKITDEVMKQLGQKVFRHILATSGIPEMIYAFKNDFRSNFFRERVTLHFSLHLTSDRECIMPINKKYPFNSVLQAMDDVAALTGEKPCVGILLFQEYHPCNNNYVCTNDKKKIQSIMKELDPEKFRLSFCQFNDSPNVGVANVFSDHAANEILEFARDQGFEAKLFSSFGREKSSACGMLGGKSPEQNISEKWLKLEVKAEEMIADTLLNITL